MSLQNGQSTAHVVRSAMIIPVLASALVGYVMTWIVNAIYGLSMTPMKMSFKLSAETGRAL